MAAALFFFFFFRPAIGLALRRNAKARRRSSMLADQDRLLSKTDANYCVEPRCKSETAHPSRVLLTCKRKHRNYERPFVRVFLLCAISGRRPGPSLPSQLELINFEKRKERCPTSRSRASEYTTQTYRIYTLTCVYRASRKRATF